MIPIPSFHGNPILSSEHPPCCPNIKPCLFFSIGSDRRWSSKTSRASLPHSPPSPPSGASEDLANMETTVAQNVFLRRRVEELQELVDSRAYTSLSTAAVEGRGARGGREKRDGRRVGAENLETPSEAAACEIILRGQVQQLRRQVRLQHCAVDASAAVTREVRWNVTWRKRLGQIITENL